MEEQNGKLTYLMCDGELYKIGKSKDPENRLKQIKTGSPYIELVCFGSGVTEKYLHTLFFQKRRSGEWFDLSEENLEKCKRLIVEGEDNSDRYYIQTNKVKRIDYYGNDTSIKKTFQSYRLTDSQIKNNIEAKKKSVDLNKTYKINFGKYSGLKLTEMISVEQYDYCVWFLNSYTPTLTKNAKKKDRKYKAFSWWVRLGYKEYMENNED